MDHYKLFIDGEFVEAQDGAIFESVDPGTGVPFATVAKAGPADVEAAIAAARRAFDSGVWSGLSPRDRADRIYDFADQVTQQTLRLAITESMDAGQVIGLSKYWGMLASGTLRNFAYYAANSFPWEEEIPFSGNIFSPGRDFIWREPVGVCVGIVPWNYPLYIATWKIAPAIVMGNTIVLKPATATPLSVLIYAEAAQAAGIPKGVINIVPGSGGELGKILCTHPDVDKIAFTGSTAVGRQIMQMAADTVKKIALELGGKSANIILDDADMDLAVNGAVFGTFFHQGQICESGTRVLVHSKIYGEFIEKMKKRAEALRVGYQLLPTSHLGPLVSAQQLATVERYVQIGKDEGAELITGGRRIEAEGVQGGYYYAPTIFTNVKNSMRIAQEEIFGPVVSVIKFDDDEEAAAIANDSIYGLGGGVFSNNTARAERLARRIRTGTVWINNYHSFGDFCPFGGYKQSGIGRDLGTSGLAEYTQIKRMHVNAYAATESNFTMGILNDETKIAFVQYNCPTNIISGRGCLPSIYKEIVNLGCKRALVMTDPGVRDAGLTKMVQDSLVGFCVGVFDRIAQDTDLDIVDEATEMARGLNADCIVSVGGGSVIDTAKAVCVTLKNGGKANDYIAINRLLEPQTPHIVIPTTSGTGSEVTNMAVIKSKTAGRKVYIVDPRITPNTAILDPRFTINLPPGLTATTAMDAMTHAVEALTSIMAQPICDGQALQAIRLIVQNLPKVITNGHDEKARANLQIAASMAGWAFTIAQVGLAHAMAHTVGILHNVPHGAACGICLPKVMRFNVDFAADKLAMAAQALGVDTNGMSERDAALAAADAVEALMEKAGHPMRLRDVGVPEESLPICAFHAIADTPSLFNARPVNDPQEVLDLYNQVY
ncbi:MAG: aldehyde dehydrogenase family protein [Syntrophales bacterium]|jgi:acyl-CoA reductase-like NAD-dependent aldehyde dehydrogenase/alcohol dehydrogenase class IV|nr:aldehyde dehydrogenase family protein [Syntrophales bacterium]